MTRKTQWHFPRPHSTIKAKTNLKQLEPVTSLPDETLVISSTTAESIASNEITSTSSKCKTEQASSSGHIDELSSTTANFELGTKSDTFKVSRDLFRDKLSKLVIQLLQPYLNNPAKVGYIRNTEDFKHLARKFTHTILEKEISRATKLEELELSKRVKIKTEEYIRNYMNNIKFKIGYSRKVDTI